MVRVKKNVSALISDSNPEAGRELADLCYALELSAIVSISTQADEIIYVNDRFCEVSQYSRKEILGQQHRMFGSGYHPASFFKELWTTILKGKVWRGVIRNRAKDGSFVWQDTTIVPLCNARTKAYRFVCIGHEVTKLKEMEEAFATLPQKIIQAQEAAGARISREIHDDLGQSLATLKMMIQAQLEQDALGGSRKRVARIIDYIDIIIAKTRSLAAGLRPATLEVLGLSTALQSLVQDFRRSSGLKISAHIISLKDVHLRGEPINLYRIVQEALTNVVRHARATRVWVDIRKKSGFVWVTVKDNGRGFALGKKRLPDSPAPGLGLSTMKERAKLLQGTIVVDSVADGGTVIKLEIPHD